MMGYAEIMNISIWRDSMEFLSEHWVLIYGMFMYGMGVLTGSIKK